MLISIIKKGDSVMAGLVPFNRRGRDNLFNNSLVFQDMINDFFNDNPFFSNNIAVDSFKVDVQEDDNEYIVEDYLPGVRREDISVELNENRLTIGVNKKEEVNEKKKNYIHRESKATSMRRSMYLENASIEDVKAKLDNGVLLINIPKENKSKSKRINIE
jgi:HSP20 family protein